MAASAPQRQLGLDIGRLAGSIRRQWWMVLGLMVAGASLGYGLHKIIPPRYTSSVSILIDPKRPGALGADTQFGNIVVDSAKVASVVSIMESSGLLAHVVAVEHLADDRDFGDPSPSLGEKVLSLVPFLPPTQELPDTQEAREARALDRLSHALRITRVGITYTIKIDVTAYSAGNAERLARAVADAYLSDQLETKYAAARRDTAWLFERLNDLRTELLNSEEAVEAIRRKYGMTETDHAPGSTLDRQAITDLSGQLTQAQGEVAGRQARYEQVEQIRRSNGSLEGLPEVAASKVISDLRSRESDVGRRVADLTAHYTPTYSDLVSAEKDRRVIQTQITAEASRIAEGIRNDYQAAAARRDALERQLNKLIATSGDQASTEGRMQLREAQRIADANRAVYESHLSHLREVEEQETRQEVEARIISPASRPASPNFPKLSMFLAGGAGVGAIAALCIVAVRELLEHRFVSVTAVEASLSLPVLGTLPMLRRRDLMVGVRRLTITEYLAVQPSSRFAEALRLLRIALRIAASDAPRIVHVTSAIPGEGKSTVAATLAISAAMSGRNSVLVDLDIRNASTSNLFGPRHVEGVADVLKGHSMIGAALQTYRKLPLKFVSAGSLMQPRTDMIDSPQFIAMIRDLAKSFDVVILDSPPVLAVSDALLISNVADVTLLVVAWRSTPKAAVQQALKKLQAVHATLAGVVLNKIKISGSRSEGGYGTYFNNYFST